MLCTASLVLAAAVTACKENAEVTALVAGPQNEVVAIDVDYDANLDPASITPESFKVEGKDVAFVMPGEPGPVLVVLKGSGMERVPAMKPGGPKPKPECCKPEAECCKPDAECCEPKAEECCEGKSECCQADTTKCQGECEMKPGKPEEKDLDIPVPEVKVQQVAALKTTDGKTIKAWNKAVKAAKVKAAGLRGFGRGHRHGQGHHPHGDPGHAPAPAPAK